MKRLFILISTCVCVFNARAYARGATTPSNGYNINVQSTGSQNTGNQKMDGQNSGGQNTNNTNYQNISNPLDSVSPVYFEINADGSLKVNTINRAYISSMHEKGVQVIPFVTNHWERSVAHAALDNAETLTTDIARAVLEYGFDGVNVDIVNAGEQRNEDLAYFITTLKRKMQGKALFISVAADSNDLSGIDATQGTAISPRISRYTDSRNAGRLRARNNDASPPLTQNTAADDSRYATHGDAVALILKTAYNGYNENGGDFNPERILTRRELARYLDRAYDLTGAADYGNLGANPNGPVTYDELTRTVERLSESGASGFEPRQNDGRQYRITQPK